MGSNPLLADPANGNFNLLAGSPAIDSGTPVDLTTDVDGQSRPSGLGYDIGAQEYIADGPTPPIISNVQAPAPAADHVTVLWSTNEPATGQVEYGPTVSYGLTTTLNTNLATEHSALVSGLDPDTVYHYRVRSQNAGGALAVSADFSFTTAPDASNQPPVARAGPDQVVTDADRNGSESVTIDGSLSTDADGSITHYQWKSGPTVLAETPLAIVSLAAGWHTLTLTVTDNDGASASDELVVKVNQPPTAQAGPDQVVTDTDRDGSQPVTLNGAGSSDPDGVLDQVTWYDAGSPVGSALTAPVVLSAGTHVLTLRLVDDNGAVATDTVTVKVNQPPTAAAGADLSLIDLDRNGSETLTLNGSASTDADGSIQSYRWTDGAVLLADQPDPTVSLALGSHLLTLTVTDNDQATHSDSRQVSVKAPPLADAGPDQNLIDHDWNGAEPATLNGSASTDADGTITGYVWKEGPVTLASGPNPTVPLSVGTHTITLTVTDNHGLTATDTVQINVGYPIVHTITATALPGGAISPAGAVEIYQGAGQTFTVAANPGYRIDEVWVDDQPQGPITSYTFTDVQADHAIRARFARLQYTITASATPGGQISPSGQISVLHGDSQAFALMPSAGYNVYALIVDEQYLTGLESYTFSNVTANHTIYAVFANEIHTIEASCGPGGQIAPSGAVLVAAGQDKTFVFTPETGYQIEQVLVDGASVGAPASYTFADVVASHTLYVSFAPIVYTITASVEGTGTIEPAGAVLVAAGGSQGFTITPGADHKIVEVLVDGVSQGPVGSYAFANVAADHTIRARFATVTYTLTATATPGGQISPAGTTYVGPGENRQFTITADAGYQIQDVKVDGVSVGPVGSYTFENVTGNHTLHAEFASQVFTITASAEVGGSVSPAGAIEVAAGGSQTFTFSAEAGKVLSDVLIDGASQGPVDSYTFDDVQADHTVHAAFAAQQFQITASAQAGGTVSPAGTILLAAGQSQTVSITPNANYKILEVLVDGVSQGSISSYTFENVQQNHTLLARFTLASHTITATAGPGGQVAPNGAVSVVAGQSQKFVFTPDAGHHVARVIVDGQTYGITDSYTFLFVDAAHSLEVLFAPDDGEVLDQTGPRVINRQPKAGEVQVPRNSLMILHLVDTESGVDPNSVVIRLQDQVVYAGGVDTYSGPFGQCRRVGTAVDYAYTIQAAGLFDFDEPVTIAVAARDRWGNPVSEGQTYSFRTEMRTFGGICSLNNKGPAVPQDYPATARDSHGTIWVAWQAGFTGNHDIYVAKKTASSSSFDTSVALTQLTSDQSRPALAIDPEDRVYVAWQDNRRGNWDIYLRYLEGGKIWSSEISLRDDPQDSADQTQPRLAVDGTGLVSVVWQDERNGNPDIYLAQSSNRFTSHTVSAVCQHAAVQSAPAIAVDSQNAVYVLWTDERDGTRDIYGASFNGSGWQVRPLVVKPADQGAAVLAIESESTILHLAWVDRSAGNQDIFYARSVGGLPAAPLTGTRVTDDSTGSDQSACCIQVAPSGSGQVRAFIAWQDARNAGIDGADMDVYFAEGADSFGANILVEGQAATTGQYRPVMGLDAYDQPYLIWVDLEDSIRRIRYGGSTRIGDQPLAESVIEPDQGGYVGTPPDQIAQAGDVCVVIPAGAFWANFKVTITPIENAPASSPPTLWDLICRYEFGPSTGTEFAIPVTITIAYAAGEFEEEDAYWYNPETGELSQSGIADVEHLILSDTVHALRFTTTHFTQYAVAARSSSDRQEPEGAGGGCDMSRSRGDTGGIVEYFLPYGMVLLVFGLIRRRDRRRTA
ncbi:MAG: fibronectin type III domain-containing protein [Sedimentisphaerales bacterium]|nr:fibronectin type III domain-containing protein [Sedimentisphaerales bacterium]